MVQDYRTPDVYFERTAPAIARGAKIEKVRIDLAGFLGLALRGPVGTPVRIQSWRAFEEIFGGFAQDIYLPHSVYGFFANGGEQCMVCRVAKLEGEGAALPATATLNDLYGRPTLRASARDPGTWGNKIRIRATPASKPPRTGLRANLEIGATEARVDVVTGFEPGAILKIADGEKVEFAVLERADRKKLVWAADQDLKSSYDHARTTIEAVQFQLQISAKDAFEIHDNLTLSPGHPRYVVERVNEASRIVVLEDLGSTTPAPWNHPVGDVEEPLSGGTDGTGRLGAKDFLGWDRGPGNRRGLLAFEDVDDLGLLLAPDLCAPPAGSASTKGERTIGDRVVASVELPAMPEEEIEAVQHALVDFCERKKAMFAVLDVPGANLDPDRVRDWRSRFDTKFAACYYPWLVALDPLGKGTRRIPPSGHVAGLYARTDRDHGVHKAPANDTLNDVVGLVRELPKDATDVLSPDGVNCIRALRGRGIRVWGARTLSSDRQWEHVNVRRVFIMIERSISEGTEWAVFEDNNWPLWKSVERQVSQFLTGIWKEGMLRGDIPADAFYVRCDEATNPPESRAVGQFVCEVGVAVVRPAEFIVFRVGQRTQDIIDEEPVS